MAEGTKLVLTFTDSDGNNAQFSYSDIKASTTTSTVVALANAMISGTEIYEKTLVTLKSAKLVTTTEEEYDLSNTEFRTPTTYNATPEPTATTSNQTVTTEVIHKN